MRLLQRVAVVTLLALPALLAFPSPLRSDEPECTCRFGRGCYHFLGAPVSPPDDPCICPGCRADRGSCEKVYPDDWDRRCAKSRRMECFLRRHAASWNLRCSEQLADSCACRGPHPEWCPSCGRGGRDLRSPEGMNVLRRQLVVEKRIFGPNAELVIVESPHFYLVTDIDGLEIATQKRGTRKLSMHELAHVYIQRAEAAFEEMGSQIGRIGGADVRTAIYLTRRAYTADRIAATYFGRPELDYHYGIREGRPRVGGRAHDGISISAERHPGDDGLYLKMLHNLGHVLIASWCFEGERVGRWSPWILLGAAHWLSRLPEKFAEGAEFHIGEGDIEECTGKGWLDKLRKQAADSRLEPMQAILDEPAFEGLTFDDHCRIWSWFHLFLAEDRKRFVKFIEGVAAGREVRRACRAAFSCTPEELDRRWRDRILGRRASIAASNDESTGGRAAPRDDEPEARPIDTRGLKEALRREKDPRVLAAAIEALEEVDDSAVAKLLIDALPHSGALVRETIIRALTERGTRQVVSWLRDKGLEGSSGVTRGFVARILRQVADRRAGPMLLRYARDRNWFARAEVARALGAIEYSPAIDRLTTMVNDAHPHVVIAALDALSQFGSRASHAAGAVAKHLDSESWQVRSAAVYCLGSVASTDAVDLLIDRLDKENGRLESEVREALMELTGDDLGAAPEAWRRWWEREKALDEGREPIPEDDEPERTFPEAHAPPRPTYFGLEVASRNVGFVLDVSESMVRHASIDKDWLRQHERKYSARAAKFDLGKHELEAMLRSLDPTDGFRLYYFSTRARASSPNVLPATEQEIDQAIGRLEANRPMYEVPATNQRMTDFTDAFRLILGMKETGDLPGAIRPTPDTICLLSDGYPTAGEIRDPDTLLTWFKELNFYARIRLHVVAFGTIETEWNFLGSLAEENGGQFMLVPDAR